MLNSIDAANTIREAREGHLIELTTLMSEPAQLPLSEDSATLLSLFATQVKRIAEAPIPGAA